MRDLAAAAHSGMVAARDRSRDDLAREEDLLSQHLETAQHQLTAARSVFELESVHEDTGVHRVAVADANVRLADATTRSELSEAALRERARQLKSSERLVDKLQEGLAKRESLSEQRANDDIASRRR
jgi:CBS-domain-containing membrane protein